MGFWGRRGGERGPQGVTGLGILISGGGLGCRLRFESLDAA